jgi:hypothetical protein
LLNLLHNKIGNYTREVEYEDIDKGFLKALDNLLPPDIDNKERARNILQKIKMNPSDKIFVAKDDLNGKVVGRSILAY